MMGYYKDDEATERAFDEDGYFRTGDFGKFDRDGNLYITGRLKNLIILSNGKNVYPEEIEKEFLSLPSVLEIVVYEGQSRPDQDSLGHRL
ncbi:MAG: AMP-binding protein, partial [Clostridia bacterium]|nr:AMP-binding protein [Clostridia bacterium]